MSDDEFDGAEADEVSADAEFNAVGEDEFALDVTGPALKSRGPYYQTYGTGLDSIVVCISWSHWGLSGVLGN